MQSALFLSAAARLVLLQAMCATARRRYFCFGQFAPFQADAVIFQQKVFTFAAYTVCRIDNPPYPKVYSTFFSTSHHLSMPALFLLLLLSLLTIRASAQQ